MNYEEFHQLARSRRSVRKFSEQPVSKEDVLRLIEAASWAPSNHNRQPWRFLVLDDRVRLRQLAEKLAGSLRAKLEALPAVASEYAAEFIHYSTFFAEAPVVIAALHKQPISVTNLLLREVEHPELVSGEPLSTAMAVQNLLLAAHTLGLGACVLTAPLVAREVVVADLHPPPGYDVTCLVAVGHPAEQPAPPRRKNIEQIIEFGKDVR